LTGLQHEHRIGRLQRRVATSKRQDAGEGRHGQTGGRADTTQGHDPTQVAHSLAQIVSKPRSASGPRDKLHRQRAAACPSWPKSS
jgi:hypothetical protein